MSKTCIKQHKHTSDVQFSTKLNEPKVTNFPINILFSSSTRESSRAITTPPIHPKPHPQPHLQQPLEFPTQVSRLPSSKFTILNPFLVPIFVLLSGFLLTVFFLFNFVQKQSGIGLIGIGNTVSIDFCTSCSYKFVQFLAFFQFRSNCLI